MLTPPSPVRGFTKAVEHLGHALVGVRDQKADFARLTKRGIKIPRQRMPLALRLFQVRLEHIARALGVA